MTSFKGSLPALLLLALAACTSPPPPRDQVLEVLAEARHTVVPCSTGELAPLCRRIEAHCDNLIHAHEWGYRAEDGSGGYDMRQGRLDETGRDLDIAIEGSGFLSVILPDNTIGYMRAGNLSVDSQGNLITLQGYRLNPPLTIPQNITRVLIDRTGDVQGADPRQPQQLQMLGQLQLTRFINPSGLAAIEDHIYRQTPATGDPQQGQPGVSPGFGQIRQGFLEESNVDTLATVSALVADLKHYRIAVEAWRIREELR